MKVFIIIALAIAILLSLGILLVALYEDEKENTVGGVICLTIFIIAEVFASQITSIN